MINRRALLVAATAVTLTATALPAFADDVTLRFAHVVREGDPAFIAGIPGGRSGRTKVSNSNV